MIVSGAIYANAAASAVNWIDENGRGGSGLITCLDVVAYLDGGGEIAPYVAPPLVGCQIVSTVTPALDGTYATDANTQAKVQAIALYIQVNGKFPAGLTALPWPDAGGTPHTFPSTTSFVAFATALGDYVTAKDLGQSPAQPSQIA